MFVLDLNTGATTFNYFFGNKLVEMIYTYVKSQPKT